MVSSLRIAEGEKEWHGCLVLTSAGQELRVRCEDLVSVCHDTVLKLEYLRSQNYLMTVSDLDLDSAPADILLIDVAV